MFQAAVRRFPFGAGHPKLGRGPRASGDHGASLIDEIIVWLIAGGVAAFALLVAAREQRRARAAMAESRAAEAKIEDARRGQAQAEGGAARARAAAKAAMDRIARERAAQQEAFDRLPAPVWRRDLTGKLVACNRAFGVA